MVEAATQQIHQREGLSSFGREIFIRRELLKFLIPSNPDQTPVHPQELVKLFGVKDHLEKLGVSSNKDPKEVAFALGKYSPSFIKELIAEIKRERSEENIIQENDQTITELKTLLWERHGIRVDKTTLRNAAKRKLVGHEDDDEYYFKEKLKERKGKPVPVASQKLGEEIMQERIDEFAKYKEAPKDWISYPELVEFFRIEFKIDKKDKEKMKNFRNTILGVTNGFFKQNHALVGKHKKNGRINRFFAPAILDNIREYISAK